MNKVVTVVSAVFLAFTAACSDTVTGLDATKQIKVDDALAIKIGDTNGYCTDLFAGQTINVGTVCSTIKGDTLEITYATTNGWSLSSTELWIGTQLATMPQTKTGNPKIGQFPYKATFIPTSNTSVVKIDMNQFGLNSTMKVCNPVNFFVAAHSNVTNGASSETAWGDGARLVERGSWAEAFAFTVKCYDDTPLPPPPVEYVFQTAWAKNIASPVSACFTSLDLDNNGTKDFSKWGWTTGPMAAGTYTFELWAGAAKCDLTKGTKVGTMTLVYNGSSATVTATMLAGFVLDETQLYIGSEPLARDVTGDFTVAPGQFPYKHDLTAATRDSYTVTGLSGMVYMTLHTVVGAVTW